MTLAKVISERGETQLHVAETEKYPHVTYFFNGGEEEPYEGEVRELVDSPRDVATYDEKPEMSAREAADAFVEHWEADTPGVRDHQLRERRHGRAHGRDRGGGEGGRDRRRVPRAGSSRRSTARAAPASSSPTTATADEMLEEDGSPDTAHSLNPVPFIVTLDDARLDGEGILADVAPTALALLGIEQPEEMTGRSLLAADD